MSDDSAQLTRLSGVGGWLAFLCFGLLVAQPLRTIGFLIVVLGSVQSDTDLFRVLGPVLLALVTAVLGLVAGVQVVRRTPHAMVWIRLALVGVALMPLGIAASIAFNQGAAAVSELVPSMIGSVLAAGIWLSYLFKSRRVVATFGAEAARSWPEPRMLGALVGVLAVLVIAPALTVSGTLPAVQATWVEYGSSGGGYRAMWPATPKTTTTQEPTELGPLTVTQDLVETVEGLEFMVSYFDFPAGHELGEIRARLDGMQNGMVNATKMVVETSGTEPFDGHPAARFIARSADSTRRMHARMVIVGRRAYTIAALRPAALPETAAEKFLDSFSVSR